jgi:hypothetical protein
VKHRTIGIIVDPGGRIQAAAQVLFGPAPLDRYRLFFRLRKVEELEEAFRTGTAPQAYDAEGRSVGPVPWTGSDGIVFIRFVDPATLPPGVTGYTEGAKSLVTSISLLHEIGHSFARLGDEYSGLSIASQVESVNLELRDRISAPRWAGLIEQGLLPAPPPFRVEPSSSGADAGRFLIPSGHCFMNNRDEDSRFCPVCQLEIISRINELAGAPLPW